MNHLYWCEIPFGAHLVQIIPFRTLSTIDIFITTHKTLAMVNMFNFGYGKHLCQNALGP
jgi:hypothetical protein